MPENFYIIRDASGKSAHILNLDHVRAVDVGDEVRVYFSGGPQYISVAGAEAEDLVKFLVTRSVNGRIAQEK